jgi:hypothetical protein
MTLISVGRRLCRRLCRGLYISAFEQLVELATIQPDTTTLGTVVDFDALALAHHEQGTDTGWTFHRYYLRKPSAYSFEPKPNK